MLVATDWKALAPCLEDGAPIADAGAEFVEAAMLGDNMASSMAKAWCVAHVFHRVEEIFRSNREPISQVREMLVETAEVLRAMASTGFAHLGERRQERGYSEEQVEAFTGDHYGNLFRDFDSKSYWQQTRDLLQVRLERNGLDLRRFQNKSLLDAGCGGGRYTFAWAALGAAPVTGVDVSPLNVHTGQQHAEESGLPHVRFEEGNVLRLPYADDSFDIVFSNGVLHHTRDWNEGIGETVRVLRPGGLGWLYLIENPGGLFWDTIEILRIVMRDENPATARMALRALGIPANRIFYMLDHVMVPINVRLTPAEVESALESAGAADIRRLTRGTDFDRAERIYQREPFAREKFGVGENRYIFSKA